MNRFIAEGILILLGAGWVFSWGIHKMFSDWYGPPLTFTLMLV